MWAFIFGLSIGAAIGAAIGFIVAALMDAGKRADADVEELMEQILRREP